MDTNLYHDPKGAGVSILAVIEWQNEPYQFDMTLVVRRLTDDALFYLEDKGCSCPLPFEDRTLDNARPIQPHTYGAFRAHLLTRSRNGAAPTTETVQKTLTAVRHRLAHTARRTPGAA